MIAIAPVLILTATMGGTVAFNLYSTLSTSDLADQQSTIIAKAFNGVDEAWRSYVAENQTKAWECETTTDAEDNTTETCERVVTDPGFPPSAGWLDALFPDHGFEPRKPEGMSWTYLVDASGDHFACLSGSVDETVVRAARQAQTELENGSLSITDQCGSTTTQTINTSGATSVTLSYKLVLHDSV